MKSIVKNKENGSWKICDSMTGFVHADSIPSYDEAVLRRAQMDGPTQFHDPSQGEAPSMFSSPLQG